jgi:predicted dehydrogenase
MTPHKVDRRRFLGTVGRLGAASLIATSTVETARGYMANDTIDVACLGTGGRCRHLMKSLAQVPGVRIAAVCDVWDASLSEGRKLADAKATATKEYRELLDRKQCSAVLIGSPDHWHVPMSVDACNAGKDVYVEKPLTHDLKEGQAVIDAQNKNNRIVQVGTQQRSMPHIQKAYDVLKAGRIGPVHKVHLTWNRNHPGRMQRTAQGVDPKTVNWRAFVGADRGLAPDQPFDEYRFRNWRWFWDFGGGIFTDLMVHWIDVAHWFLDLDHPTTATALGQHFIAKDVWETPDGVQCLLQYPNNIQAYFEGNFSNARHGAMITFMGTEGSLYIDRGGYRIFPDPGKGEVEELILSKNPPRRGADFYDIPDGELLHLTNWVECVRSRQRPTCPAEAGVSAASAAHLANTALRSGQVVKWSGESVRG